MDDIAIAIGLPTAPYQAFATSQVVENRSLRAKNRRYRSVVLFLGPVPLTRWCLPSSNQARQHSNTVATFRLTR
jgi:hypothetical protein